MCKDGVSVGKKHQTWACILAKERRGAFWEGQGKETLEHLRADPDGVYACKEELI